MQVFNEQTVAALAQRVGLQLVRVGAGVDDAIWQLQMARAGSGVDDAIWQLVEPRTMTPVLPGGDTAGLGLGELADWLTFPWE